MIRFLKHLAVFVIVYEVVYYTIFKFRELERKLQYYEEAKADGLYMPDGVESTTHRTQDQQDLKGLVEDLGIENFVEGGGVHDELSLEEADLALGEEGDRVVFTISDAGEVVSTFFSEDQMRMAREIAAAEELSLDDVIFDTIQGRYTLAKQLGLDHMETPGEYGDDEGPDLPPWL